jgi:hypothetical protein
MGTKKSKPSRIIWKTREVSYFLTGEVVLSASISPFPPKSNTPTLVRFNRNNIYEPFDSEVYVRIGDPKAPLGINHFDAVSDWKKAKIVADTVWSEEKNEWVSRSKKNNGGTRWQVTYEAELDFQPGIHLIEIKFLSSIEQVCSLVFSNWEVSVT